MATYSPTPQNIGPDIPELQTWLESRKAAIEQLKVFIEDLNKYHKHAKVVDIVGRVAAIGGALFGIGAIALTPVTGGASLVPGVIAVGAAMSGSGATVGGNIIKSKKSEAKLKEVSSIFEKDKSCSEEIQNLVQLVEQTENEIEDLLENHVKAKVTEENIDDTTSAEEHFKHQYDGARDVYSYKLDIPKKTFKSRLKSYLKNECRVQNAVKLRSNLAKGIKMARMLNILNVNKVIKAGNSALVPVFESIPKLGAKGADAAGRLFGTGGQILQLGKVVRYGGVMVSVALLPIDIYNLVKSSLELKNGSVHEVSSMIEGQIAALEDEMVKVSDYLRLKATEINNFVMLMNNILSDGCEKNLGLLINKILKRLLVLAKIVKAFDRLDVHNHPLFKDHPQSENPSAILVNCDGTNDSLYKRLSTYIWCGWTMRQDTVILLQNTALTADPILWTLFGVSISSFNSENGQGVSVLLPLNFPGDILSTKEYHSTDKDWNGRCLVVNVEYCDKKYSFTSLLAPEGKVSRDLFMKEMVPFVKHHSIGKIVLGANFRFEEQTMTVVVRNRVSRTVPFPVIRRLIPYKEVSEYLLQKQFEIDGPIMVTYQVMKKYSLIKPDKIDVKWNHCTNAQFSNDSFRDQLRPLTQLGLSDLWAKKNEDSFEFSIEKEVSERVVNCTQNLDFFVSPELESEIKHCYLDHTLRFLGFLPQSALIIR